jgi:hypothetical protein
MKWQKAGENHTRSLPDIISMIKSKRMKWVRYVARMDDNKYVQDFACYIWKEKPLRKTQAYGRIILKRILDKQGGESGLDLSG